MNLPLINHEWQHPWPRRNFGECISESRSSWSDILQPRGIQAQIRIKHQMSSTSWASRSPSGGIDMQSICRTRARSPVVPDGLLASIVTSHIQGHKGSGCICMLCFQICARCLLNACSFRRPLVLSFQRTCEHWSLIPVA